jgi:hypothetical protein
LPGAWVKQANRRIAHSLGADVQATDAARILRPPGTSNFKTGEPRPVAVEHFEATIHRADEVVGALTDPEVHGSLSEAPVRSLTGTLVPLMALAPPVYVEALTGLEVGRDEKFACPFHDDRTPSLHVYDEPERGWSCFGCGRGGTLIDFGAALYGIEPRGRGYHEIRERLEQDLLRAVAA